MEGATNEQNTTQPHQCSKDLYDEEMGQLDSTSTSSMGLGEALAAAEQSAADQEAVDCCGAECVLVNNGQTTTAAAVPPPVIRKEDDGSFQTTSAQEEHNFEGAEVTDSDIKGAADGDVKGADEAAEEDKDGLSADKFTNDDASEGEDDMEAVKEKERLCLLLEMDESLKEATPNSSYRHPRTSTSTSTNLLSNRSESIGEQNANESRVQYNRHFQAWHKQGRSRSNSEESDTTDEEDNQEILRMIASRSNSEDNDTTDEEENDNKEVVLMIAKKRAAMGSFEFDKTNVLQETKGLEEEKGKQAPVLRRGTPLQQQVQRPGAYAGRPGDGFQRVASFQKESFVIRRTAAQDTLQRATQDAASAAAIRSPSHTKRTKPRRISKRPSRIPRDKRIRNNNTDNRSAEEKEDSDLDQKPAANNTKRHTTVLCGSNHNTTELHRTYTGTDRRSRAKSLPGVANAKALANTDAEFAAHPTKPSVASLRRQWSGNASMRLSTLARSSMSIDSSSYCDRSSDQIITDLAEQSVTNFVKSFKRPSLDDPLPIAATVVPSEEDLELLIRSRLEEELQSHLTQELSHFRQNLFQEIIRQGNVQVADPVIMEEEEDELGRTTNSERQHPTLLEQFLDEEEEDDSEIISEADQDAALPTRSLNTRRLRGDFRRSIRQSIQMEFGNLEEELDAEQAQVIPRSDGAAVEATISTTQDMDDISEERPFSSSKQPKCRRRHKVIGRKEREFVFTSRGLLGSVFLVFLVGALVGAGGSILAMRSIQED